MRPLGIDAQPVTTVEWVTRERLHANNYNPNKVFPPEMELLTLSILEDGWTQPIVARQDGEIVDGFHRWTVAGDPRLIRMTGGLVPVVFLVEQSATDQQISTIRHNRARGVHGILKMSNIILDLKQAGVSGAEIAERLQMEEEEIERLCDVRSSPEHGGKESFGKGWVPDGSAIPS